MGTRQPRRRRVGLLAVIVIVAGAGCAPTGGTPTAANPARPPAPSAASEADRLAAEQAALTAYAGYLRASQAASGKSDPFHPALKKYLADPLLTRVQLAIRNAKENGAMRTGKLRSDPRVTAVSLETEPATVEIQDCLDATGYRLVYVKDRKTVPGTTGRRYLATATATRYPDGRWLVNSGTAHQDQPC